MLKIHARNFQALEDSEVVVDGLTVVTGKNNSGKSSLMRAISGCIRNTPGNAFLRHGTQELSVSLKFSDGQSIEWRKGEKIKPTYILNGKTIFPGREIPKEVEEISGISGVKAGNNILYPQIAPQMTGVIFLLDQAGSAVAEAVADVDRVGRLTAALKLAEADKRAATSELKLRRKDRQAAAEEVDFYAGLEDVEMSLSVLALSEQDYRGLVTEQKSISDLHRQMATLKQQVEEFQWCREICVPPVAEAIRSDVDAVVALRVLQDRLSQATSEIQYWTPIAHIRLPIDHIHALLQELLGLDKIRNQITKLRATLQTKPPAIPQENLLPKLIRNIGVVKQLQQQRVQRQQEVEACRKQVESLQVQLEASIGDVAELQSQIKICPTCGQAGCAE